MCPFVLQTKEVQSQKFKWQIRKLYTCNKENIVYVVQCNKDFCKQQNIGESKWEIKERFADHRKYVINNDETKITGTHFNLPVHTVDEMSVVELEKVKKAEDFYRKERE